MRRVALALLLLAPLAAAADGTPSFCLFELPAEVGAQRLINLAIVQYVELLPEEVRIAYGGGNLGSGHETRIRVKSREEALALVERMRQTARECR